MENIRLQITFTLILTLILGAVVWVSRTDIAERVTNIFTKSPTDCIKIKTGGGRSICFGEDAGVKLTYRKAQEYCKKEGKRLPSRENAWYIWISSENCKSAFASGAEVAENREQFVRSHKISSFKINNYCRAKSLIKFPISPQYKFGSFWLGGEGPEAKAYAIDYFSGTIRSVLPEEDGFGVRCVTEIK